MRERGGIKERREKRRKEERNGKEKRKKEEVEGIREANERKNGMHKRKDETMKIDIRQGEWKSDRLLFSSHLVSQEISSINFPGRTQWAWKSLHNSNSSHGYLVGPYLIDKIKIREDDDEDDNSENHKYWKPYSPSVNRKDEVKS